MPKHYQHGWVPDNLYKPKPSPKATIEVKEGDEDLIGIRETLREVFCSKKEAKRLRKQRRKLEKAAKKKKEIEFYQRRIPFYQKLIHEASQSRLISANRNNSIEQLTKEISPQADSSAQQDHFYHRTIQRAHKYCTADKMWRSDFVVPVFEEHNSELPEPFSVDVVIPRLITISCFPDSQSSSSATSIPSANIPVSSDITKTPPNSISDPSTTIPSIDDSMSSSVNLISSSSVPVLSSYNPTLLSDSIIESSPILFSDVQVPYPAVSTPSSSSLLLSTFGPILSDYNTISYSMSPISPLNISVSPPVNPIPSPSISNQSASVPIKNSDNPVLSSPTESGNISTTPLSIPFITSPISIPTTSISISSPAIPFMSSPISIPSTSSSISISSTSISISSTSKPIIFPFVPTPSSSAENFSKTQIERDHSFEVFNGTFSRKINIQKDKNGNALVTGAFDF